MCNNFKEIHSFKTFSLWRKVATSNLPIKYQAFVSIHYEDMKGDTKMSKRSGLFGAVLELPGNSGIFPTAFVDPCDDAIHGVEVRGAFGASVSSHHCFFLSSTTALG